MLEDIKTLLGAAAENYTDALISLCLKQAQQEVQSYCNRQLDFELETIAQRICIIKLNRINTEGLTSQSYSGISESYVDGYPADILAILNRKRKIKTL